MRSIPVHLALALLLVAPEAFAKPEASRTEVIPRSRDGGSGVLVRAAPLRTGAILSPRRLFNNGLSEEEQGNMTRAVQYYLSARLSARHSFADQLYARGAGYRLVRVLAGYDDDAAAAAAMLVSEIDPSSSDLAPLIRTLLRRLDDEGDGADLVTKKGVILSIRYRVHEKQSVLEMDLDGDDEKQLILADGGVGPFSAGDRVRVLVRRDRKRAYAGWRLIAVGHADADGWQMLAVSGLPGDAGEAYGALLGH